MLQHTLNVTKNITQQDRSCTAEVSQCLMGTLERTRK